LPSSITEAYTSPDKRNPKIVDHQSVAVRSSATAEDLPDASFAGQQETFLNIWGEEDIARSSEKMLGILVDGARHRVSHQEQH
jgi:pyruvate, water dikinase